MLLVVIPFTSKEVPLVLKNLALAKKFDGRLPNPVLLTCEEDTQCVADVQCKATELFATVQLFTYSPWTGIKEWPFGPNHAFKNTAGFISDSRNTKPWLWWEADATPLCKGWLEVLDMAHQAGGKPFSGHVVGGMEHMNGVGIYPPDVREYSAKALLCNRTPWDIGMKSDTQHHTHAINGLILHYWNIHEGANYNGPLGIPLSVKSRKELKRWITDDAVLLHRCKDGSVADVLLK